LSDGGFVDIFFPYRLGDSRKSACGVVAAFLFYGKIFGVPKWGALSKSRVAIDPGTAGSRELEETAVSIIRHTLKASLRTDACCAAPVDDSNSLGPCGSGNRLVPQISAQFKRSVHLFSHGELDPRLHE
jgi:hypothetical protein